MFGRIVALLAFGVFRSLLVRGVLFLPGNVAWPASCRDSLALDAK